MTRGLSLSAVAFLAAACAQAAPVVTDVRSAHATTGWMPVLLLLFHVFINTILTKAGNCSTLAA